MFYSFCTVYYILGCTTITKVYPTHLCFSLIFLQILLMSGTHENDRNLSNQEREDREIRAKTAVGRKVPNLKLPNPTPEPTPQTPLTPTNPST